MHSDNEIIFDKIYGAWTGMIAGNNNGLFFECKYGKEPFNEEVNGILTSVDRYRHTTWAFNVYDILLRYGAMTDDDTLMEWLLVEETVKLNRLPSAAEMGKVWVENLNYRNFGEGRFAVEQFEKGVQPPEHLNIDSGIPLTEYFKDWGICALIYNEVIGLLTFQCPEKLRDLSITYGSMVNRNEALEAAVFAIALQNGAMRCFNIMDVIDNAFSYIPEESQCYKEMARAKAAAIKHGDWREARKEFLDGLPKHHIADAIPNCGLVVIALILGDGDFNKTMNISIMLGYDTDCTACTVGGVIGAMVGEKAIPASWKELLKGVMTNIIWDKWEGCQRYDKYAWKLPWNTTILELSEKTLAAARIVNET